MLGSILVRNSFDFSFKSIFFVSLGEFRLLC